MSVLDDLLDAVRTGAVEVIDLTARRRPCVGGAARPLPGLTQLQNVARLPARGALVIAAPLPIVEGSGSPARVLALVQH